MFSFRTRQGQKSVSVLNSRWIPINKVQKKLTAIHEENNINEILLNSIQEQISYHRASNVRLPKGLYLGYLKMQSSVDQIQIVVPAKTPNILPHCKIRDNAHISAEEWKFLKRNKEPCTYEPNNERPSGVQELFIDSLTHAAHRLFKYMDLSPEDALTHRLYDYEVIELSPEVSFLVVCPRAESSCAVPGHREILLQRGDLLSLSIQAFEMVHLKTYHCGIIQKYSRLSCILELDTISANHMHREAFSATEVQAAKERLAKLQDLSQNLNAIWKGVRWLMDVISFARDRCTYLGLNMREIFEFNPSGGSETKDGRKNSEASTIVNAQLLQPPPREPVLIKSSPGRGSWPGPSHSLGVNGLLGAEHSKSEQYLSGVSYNLSSRYLSATSDIESSRKNSADSNCSQSHTYYSAGESIEHINSRLPPSRSEDTLISTKKHQQTPLHRKRATTVNANYAGESSSQASADVKEERNVAESLQSLSSDSDSGGVQIKEAALRSPQAGSSNQFKVTLCDEANLFEQQLHIAEKDSPVKTVELASTNPFRNLSPEKTTSNNLVSHENIRKSKRESRPETEADDDAAGALPGIIQVYAAYNTGLASGTSLKLRVTPRTTAREVIDLVVKQLNMAVVLKGKDGPIYSADKFENFCLVAVIGARERCLRDDFKPLQLQNPWKKGRLFVRQKHDLLAAIEHSNRDSQMI